MILLFFNAPQVQFMASAIHLNSECGIAEFGIAGKFVKGLSLMPPKETPHSVREVADRRSDEGNQSACAQAARAHTFVPSDKSMQKRSVTIHCLVLYKYTLSPPSTANLPKRFGLQTLPDTHQCRSIPLFIKSPPACVCWFTKRVSFTDAYFQSDE